MAEVGLSYAVLRPAILFGGNVVLINNIAWLLRHLPVFAVGGRGDHRIRAIHIEDLARLAVDLGAQRTNVVIDAVGPERPTFLELTFWIKEAVGSHARILRVPEAILPAISFVLGVFLHDVLLTREEYLAMACGLADTDGPATGTIRISEWINQNAGLLGLIYANEIERHFRGSGSLSISPMDR